MAKSLNGRLVDKLSPARVRASPTFHAIVACLLGTEGWGSPELVSVTVTSDGFLLGMREGDCGFNDFLGTKADLDDNLAGVADAAGLTEAETAYLLALSPAFKRSSPVPPVPLRPDDRR